MKLGRTLTLSLTLLTPCVALGQAPPPAATQIPPHGPHPGGPFALHPGHGKWWKNSEIVRTLGLSEQQISQLEQSFTDFRMKLIDLHAEVEREEARLQPLIEADRPDEAQVGAQLDQLVAARGKLEKTQALMMLALRRALTVEQWKKLETVRHERVPFHHPGEAGPWPARPPAAPLPPPPPDDPL